MKFIHHYNKIHVYNWMQLLCVFLLYHLWVWILIIHDIILKLSLMDGKVVPLLKFNKIILLIVRVLTTNATHIISNYYINSGYYNAKCSLIILGGCKCMRIWEYLLKNALYDSNTRTVFITQKFDWRKGQL